MATRRGSSPRGPRKPGLRFPDPNQTPKLPFPPPPVKPADPGCSTGTGLEVLKKILKGGR